MREIVFDTETTGLDPFSGDKIVEIGAVELINHIPTGKTYHQYVNPLRSLSEEVVKVHGLTEEFLSDKPTFDEIAKDFLDFIGDDSHLVAHNAVFDMKFLNYELKKAGLSELDNDRVIDTLIIARKKFPGSRVSLDELCKRFCIDNTHRTFHGALLDSELLANVYLELLGGKEPGLILGTVQATTSNTIVASIFREYREPRFFNIPEAEFVAHAVFLEQLKTPLWLKEEEL